MHRRQLLELLDRHKSRFMEEVSYVRRARDYIEGNEDVFYRELWPAHVTGSAWVVNPARTHVLMLHHRKHDQWFQPGGHADGDADIVRVALRETAEESGLDPARIRLVSEDIFDVDIHAIPAMHGDPAHEHIDIRFLVEIDDRLEVPGNHESNDILWLSLMQVSRYNNNRSTHRMVEKTRQLRNRLSSFGAGR
ncbi:MAG: NUDIX hydrolase [Gammaproteobacteria bacterium]|nr:NUDIX hydrolase [Gammaproteobacteria bacterium]